MHSLSCAIGEAIHAGDGIRIHLTGRIDRTLYLFVEAAWGQPLEAACGFHASAPCDFGWNAHVLAACDGDSFQVGEVNVHIEDARNGASPAQLLRDVRLHVLAPTIASLTLVPRARPARQRRKAG